MNNSYLYRHIRNDTNQVFYVGVGTGRNYERANSIRGRNTIWNRIVKKTKYEVEIIIDNLNREYALEKEKEFIELYGRIDLKNGTLCNLTEGGDGCIGFSQEVKNKMSAAQKGNKKWKLRKSNDYCRLMGLSNKGKKLSKEQKRKISETRIGEKAPFFGKTHSNKTKITISLAKQKPVAQYSLDGNLIREYKSIKETELYGFEKSSVSKCCLGKQNKHKKYIFKFINN